jgi:hypothetical protein
MATAATNNSSTYSPNSTGYSPSLPGYQGLLFNWGASPDKLGAPILTSNVNVIDVFNEFDWTVSPRAARQIVPRAILTEYRQTQSSELRGFLYSIRGAASNLAIAGAIGAQPLNGFTQSVGQEVKTAGTIVGQNSIGSTIVTALNSTVDKATSLSTQALEQVQNANFVPQSPSNAADALNPYNGLYSVEETGFTYILPYYSSTNMVDVNNSWGNAGGSIPGLSKMASGVSKIAKSLVGAGGSTSTSTAGTGEGGIGEAIGGISDIAGGGMDMLYGAAAGLHGNSAKEDIKMFNGTSAEEGAKFTFFLYNTIGNDITTLQCNWDFCYIITYQNLPNRKGINFLDAPCLYRIDIPGFKQIPLAYLNNISIENIGNTRLVNLTNGTVVTVGQAAVGDPNIKLMPEAYRVTLEFKGVLKNTRNTFLFNADPSQKITITTKSTSAY